MYDVLIVGGGMVGASLALALQPLKLKIGMVDAVQFDPHQTQAAYDDRSVALSYGSLLIYQGMGMRTALCEQAQAIQQIHVSDRGHFGASRLSAMQEGVPALGYVIESKVLGRLLYQRLQAVALDIIAPARVTGVQQNQDAVQVTVQQAATTQSLHARLLVIADGGDSSLRKQLGITVKISDYDQQAVIANVSTAKAHAGVAYERFTAEGPLALLPLTRERYSLVWTKPAKQIDAVMKWDNATFLQQLQQAFGYRQGRFTQVGERSLFPLRLVKSSQDIASRAVIVGNASHTLHPVAGQGLNLSLRDIAVLAAVLMQAVQEGGDVGDSRYLLAYQQQRQADYRTTIAYTDSLIKVFANNAWLLGHLRAAGLVALDRFPPLRHCLAQQSMGLLQSQCRSRLARGLPLRTG